MIPNSTPSTDLSPAGPWLEHSGLNEGDVAQARTHWQNAERLVDTLFALAEGMHLGPERIDSGLGSAPAHVRRV
jgi:hypothetical protein